MYQETRNRRQPFAKQAARASVFAPMIGFCVNVLTTVLIQDSPGVKMVAGFLCLGLILSGFIFALIGFSGIKKHGARGILGWSIAGLLINGCLIALFLHSLSLRMTRGAQPPLTIATPAGYDVFPEGMKNPDVLHSYVKRDPTDHGTDIVCNIIHLDGYLDKDEDLSSLTSNPRIALLKEKWKGHDIDVVRIEEEQQGVPILTFNAQVPLLPRAIQVNLAGMKEREEELRQDLRTILAGIEGPSNW